MRILIIVVDFNEFDYWLFIVIIGGIAENNKLLTIVKWFQHILCYFFLSFMMYIKVDANYLYIHIHVYMI